MDRTEHIDEDLKRILEIAHEMGIQTLDLTPATGMRAPVWPWQVPQVPAYTASESES